nr:MAG TPA: hypothetical protein [Bacteriophage sp.]
MQTFYFIFMRTTSILPTHINTMNSCLFNISN